MTTNWANFLDEFGKALLNEIRGGWVAFETGEYNPVTREIKEGNFVEKYKRLPGFNRTAVSRVVVLCQMSVYDAQRGPEGDGGCKGLRRHWYAYFKSEFAQPFALQIGDFKVNSQGIQEIRDEDWSSRLSTTYAELVDSGKVTYRDLWVDDTSRMFDRFWSPLYDGFHLLLCVEKDSLFDDFRAAARAIGATALYSGKGKTSKAATEKVLRESFHWNSYSDPFRNEPLVILHISDYDYDGQAVIGPTFGEQARRYTSNIIEARIGVNPAQVQDIKGNLTEAWYTIKVSNKGYQDWADTMAIYELHCPECGSHLVGQGTHARQCPECLADIPALEDSTPHGYEVESLRTKDYYSLIVDALLRVLPFEDIVMRLREECVASVDDTCKAVLREVVSENDSYKNLLEEIARLEQLKSEFEQRVLDEVETLARGHESDWEDSEDDPTEEDFKDHVVGSSGGYVQVWRPFSQEVRTQKMVDWVLEEKEYEIQSLKEEEITW